MSSGRYAVYIATNKNQSVLYTGVTSDLQQRIYQHKQKVVKGFTKRYNVSQLVYYELFNDIQEAIAREKQIKGGSREKKIELIEHLNPSWRDLYDDFEFGE